MRLEFVYIANRDALIRACKELTSEKEIGVDIECENNFHHYGVYISIIQISTKNRNFIIDLLKVKEISPLIIVLENPKITKIFHNVDFDFRILGTQFNCRPKNIFDTQQVSVFLGKTDLGLGALLKEYFGIEKKKQFQKADWTRRPINKSMLSYAVKDSMYLIPLKKILEKKLKEKGRFAWAQEEFKKIEKTNWECPRFTYSSMKGYKTLTDNQRARLKELFNTREVLAKQLDKPIHFVMNNKYLLKLVEEPPKGIEGWKNIRRVHPAVRANANKFFLAVKKSKDKRITIEKTKRKRHTETQKRQLLKLNELREALASKLNVDPYVIMNKEQMKNIIINQNFDSLNNWQRDIVKKNLRSNFLDSVLVK